METVQEDGLMTEPLLVRKGRGPEHQYRRALWGLNRAHEIPVRVRTACTRLAGSAKPWVRFLCATSPDAGCDVEIDWTDMSDRFGRTASHLALAVSLRCVWRDRQIWAGLAYAAHCEESPLRGRLRSYVANGTNVGYRQRTPERAARGAPRPCCTAAGPLRAFAVTSDLEV